MEGDLEASTLSMGPEVLERSGRGRLGSNSMKSPQLGRVPQVKLEEAELGVEEAAQQLAYKRAQAEPVYSSPTSPDSLEGLQGGESSQGSCAGAPPVDIKFRPPRKAPVGGKWTEEEDQRLREIVEMYGAKNWKRLASILGNVRSDVQCLHRWNKVLRPGLSKGPWTAEEDKIVKDMVLKHGAGNIKWSVIAAQLPGRIGKQCRERWFNHLDPEIKKGDWTPEEDNILFETQRIHGNRWSEIAKLLPGRTENAVKNRWNSSARKRWLRDKGLSDASVARAPAPATARGVEAPLPPHARPPPLAVDHGRASLTTSITQLLEYEQNVPLGVADSVDYLQAFDGNKSDAADVRTTGFDAGPDLRASDDMDFSKAVDYLSMDPFGADTSRSRDDFNFVASGLDAAQGHHHKPTDGTCAALSMLPPSAEGVSMTSSFDSGLQAALNGVTPPAPTAMVPPPAALAQQPPKKPDALPPATEDSRSEAGPLSEQLQRAATVAVERIVANSSEKDVPLTMLPYFHFLNVSFSMDSN